MTAYSPVAAGYIAFPRCPNPGDISFVPFNFGAHKIFLCISSESAKVDDWSFPIKKVMILSSGDLINLEYITL